MKKLFITFLITALVLPAAVFAQAQSQGQPQQPQDPQGMQQGQQGMQGMPSPFGMTSGPMDQERGLKQLQKRTRGMQKPVKHLERIIEKLQNAGYTVPQAVLDSLAKAKAAIAAIEAAANFDAADLAMEDFNDFIDVLDENIEALQMLSNFPRLLKQAERQLGKLLNTFEKVKSRLAETGADLSKSIAEVQAKVDALRTALDAAKAFAQAGKAEDAFIKLEDEFFQNLEDAFQSVGMLQAVSNLAKGAVKGIEKGIAKAERIVERLKKDGLDTAALTNIINQSKAKLQELRDLLASANFNPDNAVDIVEALDDLRMQFEEGVEDLTGKNLHGPQGVNFFMPPPPMPKELKMGPPSMMGGPGASGFEKMEF